MDIFTENIQSAWEMWERRLIFVDLESKLVEWIEWHIDWIKIRICNLHFTSSHPIKFTNFPTHFCIFSVVGKTWNSNCEVFYKASIRKGVAGAEQCQQCEKRWGGNWFDQWNCHCCLRQSNNCSSTSNCPARKLEEKLGFISISFDYFDISGL